MARGEKNGGVSQRAARTMPAPTAVQRSRHRAVHPTAPTQRRERLGRQPNETSDERNETAEAQSGPMSNLGGGLQEQSGRLNARRRTA
jgi:hypothetical protein